MPIDAPRINAPSLADLVDAPADVRAGADGVRWQGPDFSGLTLSAVTYCEAELVSPVMDQTTLGGCRFVDVRLRDVDVVGATAPRSTWRDCEILGGRIGALSITDATVSSVIFSGLRLGYLSLRGSKVYDAEFRDCVIDELDLGMADVQRVAVNGSSIKELHLHQARLSQVDLRGGSISRIESPAGLRGALISTAQLMDLAPTLAAGYGIRVD